MRLTIRWAVLLLLLVGCTAEPTTAVIDLANLQPLPTRSATAVVPLRVAVAAITSPQGTVDSYSPLLDYLGSRLERPVELVQRRTYAEVNSLIQNGAVDLAFVCTSAYISGAEEFDLKLLVAPQVQGETVYYSFLIVPANSPAQEMADLRGQVFAFTDPMSNSGRNYPTYLVQQLGETPESFFSRTIYTYSHDDAIRAVANGVADGAAVDSLVYHYAVQREPELGQQTRVIHQSPPFGIPPVVVNPQMRPQLYAELQTILLEMADDAVGQSALASVGIDHFVTIEDAAYDSARQLQAEISP